MTPDPWSVNQVFKVEIDVLQFFFNHENPITVDILPEWSTMTEKYYCENVLQQIVSNMNEIRPF